MDLDFLAVGMSVLSTHIAFPVDDVTQIFWESLQESMGVVQQV